MQTPQQALEGILAGGKNHAVLLTGQFSATNALATQTMAKLLNVAVADLARQPNIVILERPTDKKTGEKKQQIPVEDVTDFCARLALSGFGDGKKIGLVYDAEAMNAYGQNALLKSLEEPKGDTFLFLLAEYPDRLLPTIRSRVAEIAVSGVAIDEELVGTAAAFVSAGKTDRLLQAVTLTKGDSAAGAERLQAFVAQLALHIHTTLWQKCATMTPDSVRAHAKALALLTEAPRALRDHANPTLVLEAIALALP